MNKLKFQDFKDIGYEIKQFLVTLVKYNFNINFYLEKHIFSENDISEIKNKLTMNFKTDEFKDNHTFFMKRLGVESFYYNHELFNKLELDYNNNDFLKTLDIDLWNDNFNIITKRVDLNLLKKAHNNKQFCDELLHNIYIKSIHNNNLGLFEWVRYLIDYSNSKLNKDLVFLIVNNGTKIKNTPIIHEHLLSILPLNDSNLKIFQDQFFSNNKKIKNLSDFYDIPFYDFNLPLDHIPQEYSQKQLKNKQPTTKELIQYLDPYSHNGKTFERMNFLKRNNLLQNDLFEYLSICSDIFNFQDKYKNILSLEQMDISLINYKNYILSDGNLDRFVLFLDKFPKRLYKEDIEKLITNQNSIEYSTEFYSPIEKESIEIAAKLYPEKDFVFIKEFLGLPKEFNINNDFYYNKKDEINIINLCNQVFNHLFNKYPEYMNNESFLLELAEKSTSDIMISTYAKHFFKNNNNQYLKETFTQRLTIFNNHSKNPLTFNWIADEQQFFQLINNNSFIFTKPSFNIWVPLLIEKYKFNHNDIIEKSIYSYMSNDNLFKYILHSYPLTEKTQQKLCNSIYSINNAELATELMKKDIAPNDHYTEKFNSHPTEAGQILLKSKLKKNLELEFNQEEQKIKTNKTFKV